MNKKIFWQWLPPLLIAVALLAVWRDRQSPPIPQKPLPCVSLNQACTTSVNGLALQIGVIGPIKSMQAFELWVKAPQVKKIEARFTMKAMDMGINAFPLKADKVGTFRAPVTLAACMSGDRDWIMILDVDGAVFTLPFVMEP